MIEELQSEQADIETSSEDYTTRFSGTIGKYFLDVQSKITLDLLKNEKVKSILDIGGGHAQLAVPLIYEGYSVTVTGSDDSCKTRLISLLDENTFRFKKCNFLNLPFEDNSFDAVVSFRLLTHEKNWNILIKEMSRVSKGVIIIDYPDLRSFNIMYDLLFKLKRNFEKNTRTFRSFTRKELKEEFSKYFYNVYTFKPQYFLPMVIHRVVKNVAFSKLSEGFFKFIGFQYLFGTPVILKINSTKK